MVIVIFIAGIVAHKVKRKTSRFRMPVRQTDQRTGFHVDSRFGRTDRSSILHEMRMRTGKIFFCNILSAQLSHPPILQNLRK